VSTETESHHPETDEGSSVVDRLGGVVMARKTRVGSSPFPPPMFWTWTLKCSLIILFGQLALLPGIQGSVIRLNVPRVRLPYFDTFSVNFTLHVDTPGCYKW